MKYAELWRTSVPRSGQATTVQGELIRAVEKLRDLVSAVVGGRG